MKKDNYKQLGNYIELVNMRNSDLAISKLVGVSIEKKFIPSIANIIGTDLSPYKIIKHNQFAYGPVTSRNGEKITIALYKDDDDAILSQAYEVFKIKDTKQLLPEYLMLWVKRPEFDRYARYMSHGSVRELFSWEEMCKVMLPVPPIEEQRRIVSEYQTIEARIKNNEALIQKLEETAQAIYHHTFVEGIDEENLPEGWRMESLFNISTVIYGYPFDSELFTTDSTKTPLIRIRDIISNSSDTYTSEKVDDKYYINRGDLIIGMDGGFHMSIWSGEKAYQNQRTVRIIAKDISILQIYMSIAPTIKALEASIEGTTVAHLSDKHMKELRVILATDEIQKKATKEFETISNCIINLSRELHHLRSLLSLLTSKLA